ncbi:hypothetical protein SNEBB_009779 [Seison nebaliae]|nr:hypothetical protein SNEBB_009779 [Seison nebaliae]
MRSVSKRKICLEPTTKDDDTLIYSHIRLTGNAVNFLEKLSKRPDKKIILELNDTKCSFHINDNEKAINCKIIKEKKNLFQCFEETRTGSRRLGVISQRLLCTENEVAAHSTAQESMVKEKIRKEKSRTKEIQNPKETKFGSRITCHNNIKKSFGRNPVLINNNSYNTTGDRRTHSTTKNFNSLIPNSRPVKNVDTEKIVSLDAIKDLVIHILSTRSLTIRDLNVQLLRYKVNFKSLEVVPKIIRSVAYEDSRNRFVLKRDMFKNIDLSWSFYTEEDKRMIRKRMKENSPIAPSRKRQLSAESSTTTTRQFEKLSCIQKKNDFNLSLSEDDDETEEDAIMKEEIRKEKNEPQKQSIQFSSKMKQNYGSTTMLESNSDGRNIFDKEDSIEFNLSTDSSDSLDCKSNEEQGRKSENKLLVKNRKNGTYLTDTHNTFGKTDQIDFVKSSTTDDIQKLRNQKLEISNRSQQLNNRTDNIIELKEKSPNDNLNKTQLVDNVMGKEEKESRSMEESSRRYLISNKSQQLANFSTQTQLKDNKKNLQKNQKLENTFMRNDEIVENKKDNEKIENFNKAKKVEEDFIENHQMNDNSNNSDNSNEQNHDRSNIANSKQDMKNSQSDRNSIKDVNEEQLKMLSDIHLPFDEFQSSFSTIQNKSQRTLYEKMFYFYREQLRVTKTIVVKVSKEFEKFKEHVNSLNSKSEEYNKYQKIVKKKCDEYSKNERYLRARDEFGKLQPIVKHLQEVINHYDECESLKNKINV